MAWGEERLQRGSKGVPRASGVTPPFLTRSRGGEGVGAARAVGAKICEENGLEAGLQHFTRHLPLADMVCDVSTLLREKAMGRVFYPSVRLKVSDEVHLKNENFNRV